MKITALFIASSLFALTLVPAHGAVLNKINPVCGVHITAPTQAEVDSFTRELEPAKPIILILHTDNDGAKVTIPNGALVTVILDASPGSTGSDWFATFSSPDILAFQSKNTKQAPSHLIGAPCQESWTFKAIAAGQTILTFSLSRSWGKEMTPIQIVHFDITVE